MVGGIKNNNHSHPDENNMLNLTQSRKHWLAESVCLLSFSTSGKNKQIYPSVLRPVLAALCLPAVSDMGHTLQLETIRRESVCVCVCGWREGELDKEVLSVPWVNRPQSTQNMQTLPPASLPRIRTDAAAHSSLSPPHAHTHTQAHRRTNLFVLY